MTDQVFPYLIDSRISRFYNSFGRQFKRLCSIEGNIMKDKIKKLTGNMSVPDWIIWGALAFFCFISFQHNDISHTGGSSIAFLQGHILDFYEYNEVAMDGCAYMPTTYALFAIWNIPIYLMGWITEATMFTYLKVRLWYKLGTTVLYMLTAYFMAKICRLRGMDHRTSLWVAFLFVSNPIAMYSQFIFGQYDIITVFFMVLGTYFYFKDERKKFIAAFAIAVTCKYFALLFFVPMLLMKEKKVIRLIIDMLGFGSLFIIEVLVYAHSYAFRDGVFGFGATGFIMNVSYNNGFFNVSIVPILWVLICGICYFVKFPEDKKDEWMLFLLNMVVFIVFGLSFWNPQWLLLAVPYWTFAVAKSRHFKIYILLDLMLYGVFVIFITSFWVNAVDQHLFSAGVFGPYWDPYLNGPYNMAALLRNPDSKMAFTIFVSILLTYTVFLMPKYLLKDSEVSLEGYKWPMRIRCVLGVAGFVSLALVAVYLSSKAPVVADKPDEEPTAISDMLTDKDIYQQRYVSSADEIAGIGVMFDTYNSRNDCNVVAKLLAEDGKTVLGAKTVNASGLKIYEYSEIMLDEPVKIGAGTPYIIQIQTEGLDDDMLSIITTEKQTDDKDPQSYAIINDNKMKFDLGIVSYSK